MAVLALSSLLVRRAPLAGARMTAFEDPEPRLTLCASAFRACAGMLTSRLEPRLARRPSAWHVVGDSPPRPTTVTDSMVAAAAVLGENQCVEDDPGSLSAGGCALANVGTALAIAADRLSAESQDWEGATDPLGEAAIDLDTAAASLDAGPDLSAAGDEIELAGSAISAYGSEMRALGSLPAHSLAGTRLDEAGAALREAGGLVREVGERLEAGRLYEE